MFFFKTAVARSTLDSISEEAKYVPVFINFSAQTSSNRTQEMVVDKLEKRRKNVLGAPKGKRVILFVDDLNMPKLDTYGSQPPIELLRQMQDFGGLYDRDKLAWIKVEDVTMSAACGPPGGGRNHVTTRLIRHFTVLSIPPPSELTLRHIFSSIMTVCLVLATQAPEGLSSEVLAPSSGVLSGQLKGLFEALFEGDCDPSLLPCASSSGAPGRNRTWSCHVRRAF